MTITAALRTGLLLSLVASAAAAPKATLMIEQGGTPVGNIVVELDADKAPVSVANFIRYAEADYYDGLIFHRVIKNFMIQGGGFTPAMDQRTEGLTYGIKNEWQNGLKNAVGTIAMARLGGQPDSATAQFFINVVDNPNLDRPQRDGAGYAVFGKVVEGMDIVETIRNTEVVRHPKYPSRQPVTPKTPFLIKDVTISGDFDRKAAMAKLDAWEKPLRDAEAKKAAERKELMDKLAAEHGKTWETSGSGLAWMTIVEGSGDSPPTPSTRVRVHYTGKFMDGTQFDSSRDRGEPAAFGLDRVIRGWTEGVGSMKVGERRLMIIPSELGYGSPGTQGIPPDSPLFFDVELLEIIN